VSITVPVFNGERYLRESLESIVGRPSAYWDMEFDPDDSVFYWGPKILDTLRTGPSLPRRPDLGSPFYGLLRMAAAARSDYV